MFATPYFEGKRYLYLGLEGFCLLQSVELKGDASISIDSFGLSLHQPLTSLQLRQT